MSDANPSAEALVRARAIYPNQGMHRNAEFIASLHPRAIDYLEQAPVLAASFGVKFNSKADRLYIASRIGGPISRGERLRSVMSAVQIHTPLRKLTGYAIQPFMSEFVRDLIDISPSTLSQCIPEKPKAQREWLSSLQGWRYRFSQGRQSGKRGFSWIARNAALCGKGQSSDIADFVCSHPSLDFKNWTFAQMENEVRLWHDRLAADQSVSRYGLSIKPDTVIDLSDWPDHVEIPGFEFFKLSTPSMLMEDGRRMRHCVASYIPQVMNGSCHLYSIRSGMRRMATMEIVGNRVAQLKGFANAAPNKAVEAAAQFFVTQHKIARAA